MSKTIHIIGNGDNSVLFNDNCKGTRIVCNLPPFEVSNVYATTIVDFKMMSAITEGSVNLDGFEWILGNRPKVWMDNHPMLYLKKAPLIKEFYLTVPKYAGNATNFNCGHMATHYAANRLKGTEIHMYGFDSIFDHNMRSYTDVVLSSDRSNNNNHRLLNNWRPIWFHIFREFPDVQFVLYHKHANSKINLPENVAVRNSA